VRARGARHWGQGLHTGSVTCVQAAVEESSSLVSPWRPSLWVRCGWCEIPLWQWWCWWLWASWCWGDTAPCAVCPGDVGGYVWGSGSASEAGAGCSSVPSSSLLLLAMKWLTRSRHDLMPSWKLCWRATSGLCPPDVDRGLFSSSSFPVSRNLTTLSRISAFSTFGFFSF